MKKESVDKIMKVWEKRYGKNKIDQNKLMILAKSLELSPHEDGRLRITLIEDKKTTYLVPMEDVILFGLKAEDVKKYPKEKKK
jgi:hypothetical protein